MIRAAKHIHIKDLETESTYRMVDEDGRYFIFGEGQQKASSSRIVEIEPFCETFTYPSLEELVIFAIKNKKYTLDYISQYGFRVIADQYGINGNDWATMQRWHFLSHIGKHPELIDYMEKTLSLYYEFVNLMRQERVPFTELQLRDFKFQNFCLFNWIFADWQIYILEQRTETPFAKLLASYAKHNGLGEVSIKETLNHLSKGDLGERIEKILDFRTFKNPELAEND